MAIIDITLRDGVGDGARDGTNTFSGDISNIEGQLLASDTSLKTFDAPASVFESFASRPSIFRSEIEGIATSKAIVLESLGNISNAIAQLTFTSFTTVTGANIAGGGGGNISFIADRDNDGIGSYSGASTLITATSRNISISGAGVATGRIETRATFSAGTKDRPNDSSARIPFGFNGGSISLNSSGNLSAGALLSSTELTNVVDVSGREAPQLEEGSGDPGNGGSIDLKSLGNIDANDILTSSFTTIGKAGDGGLVTVNSSGNISLREVRSTSQANTGTSGNGGAISISGSGSVSTSNLISSVLVNKGDAKNGGDIAVDSLSSITTGTGALVSSSRANTGNSGNGGLIAFNSTASISTNAIDSTSSVGTGNAGNGGGVSLNATTGNINTAVILATSTADIGRSGNGGAIALKGGGDINTQALSTFSQSNSSSAGSGGAIGLTSGGNINTQALSSLSQSNNANAKDGGAIILNATGKITINSNTTSQSLVVGNGNSEDGGEISIESSKEIASSRSLIARSLVTGNGNTGNGGLISLKSSGKISVVNLDSSTGSNSGNLGNGGDITAVAAGNIVANVIDSKSFVANNGNAGNGGKIFISGVDSLNTSNLDSRSFVANTGNAGNGGAITINSNRSDLINIDIRVNTGSISSAAQANNGNSGNGGAIALNSPGSLDSSSLTSFSKSNTSNNFTQVNSSGVTFNGGGSNSGNGGAIAINSKFTFTSTGSDLSSFSEATSNNRIVQSNRIFLNGIIGTATLNGITARARNGGAIGINTNSNIVTSNLNSYSQAKSDNFASKFGTGSVVVRSGGAIAANGGDVDLTGSGSIIIVSSDLSRNINSYSQATGSIRTQSTKDSSLVESGSFTVFGGNYTAGNGGKIAINNQSRGDVIVSDLNSYSLATASNSISSTSFGDPVGNPGNSIAGDGGAIAINTLGRIRIGNLNSSTKAIAGIDENGGFAAGTASSGNGGAITLNTSDIINAGILNSSSQVFPVLNTQDLEASSTVVGNTGDGGAISINTSQTVTIASLFSATSAVVGNSGNGGAIAINAGNFTTSFINTSSSSDTGTAGNGGAIAISGTNVNITNTISSISNLAFNGAVGTGGNVNLSANGNLDIQAINSNNLGAVGFGDITLTGNEINLNGGISSVAGVGKNLVLQAFNPSETVVVGGTEEQAGGLNITNSDLSAIASGFNSTTIGRSDGSGFIAIRTANFKSPVIFRSPNGQVLIDSVSLNGNLEFNASTISLSQGLSLTLGKDEEIVNTGNLDLRGTLNLNGFNETANQLTIGNQLSPGSIVQNSVIDFGNGSSKLAFASSSNQIWSGTLTIDNWSPTSGEVLRFGTDATGLSALQLSQIQFTGFAPGAQITSGGFVIPKELVGGGVGGGGVGTIGNGIVNGTTGNDLIFGGTGRDRLSGGAGNDILNGGRGGDLLFGGAGADVFQYADSADSLVTSPDRIADFNQIQGDRFQLLSGNPTGKITEAGTISALNLIEASSTAFNGLGSGQAVFFGFNNRSYLGVNDNNSSFNSGSDLLVEVTGFTRGTNLNASSYFV